MLEYTIVRSVEVRELALLEVPHLPVGVLLPRLQGLYAIFGLVLPQQKLLHPFLLNQRVIVLLADLSPLFKGVLSHIFNTIFGAKVSWLMPSLIF